MTRTTRTSIPANSKSSIILLATAGNTVLKRSLVPTPDLGIHETAARAEIRDPHQARTVVELAHDLIGGTHPSQSYPARQRLRILLYSARRLLALTRAGPASETRGTSP
ncbi:hypothetical protein ACH4YO_41945 [Streptomyces noursei]|uniref:hypothetical protein n=1 Tax=Streptomyces noursei TaxID=1971 RepID=UPI0033E3C500